MGAAAGQLSYGCNARDYSTTSVEVVGAGTTKQSNLVRVQVGKLSRMFVGLSGGHF